jgi:hypothetical protein
MPRQPSPEFRVERTPANEEKEEETVDGHVCKIENNSFTPPDERPVRIKMKLWEAEDRDGFPVKIEVCERQRIDPRNICGIKT